MIRQRGFTLVEMVVTIVILGIALVSVASIFYLGSSNSANVMLESRAIALGYAYLDEIMGRRFDEKSDRSGLAPCFNLPPGSGRRCTAVADLGPDGGETTRERFDDVDDYDGLVEGDGQPDPIRDATGTERAGYENFYVSVSVRYAGTDAFIGKTLTDAKLITVEVRHRSQDEGWFFSVYRANY